MTSHEPYNQETDLEFDRLTSQIKNSSRQEQTVPHVRNRTAEERKAGMYTAIGCSAVILSSLLGIAVLLFAVSALWG